MRTRASVPEECRVVRTRRECAVPQRATRSAAGSSEEQLLRGGVLAARDPAERRARDTPHIAFKVVDHCLDGERNETTIVPTSPSMPRVVSIGRALNVRIHTKVARRFVVLFSPTTTCSCPVRGFTGRDILGPHPIASSPGTTTARVIQTLSVPIPNDTGLIGSQWAVQGAFGPIGGPYGNLGLPAVLVIGP